ncbi:MAG: hypothetical protein WCP85_31130 [Mariniphaga sp.]
MAIDPCNSGKNDHPNYRQQSKLRERGNDLSDGGNAVNRYQRQTISPSPIRSELAVTNEGDEVKFPNHNNIQKPKFIFRMVKAPEVRNIGRKKGFPQERRRNQKIPKEINCSLRRKSTIVGRCKLEIGFVDKMF